MSIQEQSAKTGEWLFRWRSFLPLVLLVIIIPAYNGFSYPAGSHAYDLMWEMFCFAMSLSGLLLRAYTVGYAPRGTSGRNTRSQVADTLNTTGMYSLTRNPLYLGNFLIMLGVILCVRNWWLCIVYGLAFCLYYERIIMAEETFLINKFGKEYKDYVTRTPAFIPNFKLWRRPILPFSFRNALKREYIGFFNIVVAFTILEFFGDYIVKDKIVFDLVWVSIFTFSLIVYITTRILVKKTRLLCVEGR
jgi:protein-S-isoprenylcysteine O-methyltransferase Ste14